MQSGRFLTGSTMRHVVRMTLSGAVGLTFVFLVDAANLFWLSRFGSAREVAAIGYAHAVQFFAVSIGAGLMIAATAMVSQSIGRGQNVQARSMAGSAIFTAMVIQSFVAMIIIWGRHDVIAWAGAEGQTAQLAARYLALSMPGLGPMAAAMVCSGVLRADGFAARAMYISLFSGAVLMFVDPVLIYFYGLDGAAIGVVIFRLSMMALAIYLAIYSKNLVSRPDKAELRAFCRPFAALALPAVLTQIATPMGNYLLTIEMARYGDEAIAAWAVVGRLTVLVFGGIFALSGAIGGIFGQNYGAGQYDRVRSTYVNALIFCAIYTVIAWGLMIGATPVILRGFDLHGASAEIIHAFTYVGVGGFVFVGALFVAGAAFNNLDRPMRASALGWLKGGALSWPAAMFFSGLFGASGVIYGQSAAGAVCGCFAALWGWLYVRRLGA